MQNPDAFKDPADNARSDGRTADSDSPSTSSEARQGLPGTGGVTGAAPQDSSPDRVFRQARRTLDQIREELLAERTESGHWVGRLAASSLSTATAVSAMSAVLLQRCERSEDESRLGPLRRAVVQGMAYLSAAQNVDGGFGDTDRSHSNIATSYLALAASTLADRVGAIPLDDESLRRLDGYLDRAGRLAGLRERYGKDKTFVVPIMNNMAIAGLISWDEVAALPFEAAVFPQSMYRFLQMPVVSYAIPALVAIGQARHFLGRRTFWPIRLVRSMSVGRTLKVLRRMQPDSGGYLEATPLTAFVVMSLAATGRDQLDVVEDGLRFLTESMDERGAWPIDTNLATWATSLAVHALACDPQDDGNWCSDSLVSWHLGCQHLQRHPFTGAEPGGWGWTDLSGAVPDSDDTPGAILALALMHRHVGEAQGGLIVEAVGRAADWLSRLQNRNGGWPTFCRGWGKLPFDRSSTDLTAHALRALDVIQARWPAAMPRGAARSRGKGVRYLERQQETDGSWLPLWFGNQDLPDETNPVYGTAKVLTGGQVSSEAGQRAIEYLLSHQNPDGGWGGGPSVPEKIRQLLESDSEIRDLSPVIGENLTSSVEETALAVEALATVILQGRDQIAAESGLPATDSGECSLGMAVRGNEDLRSDLPAGGLNEADRAEIARNFAAGTGPLQAAILRGVDFLTVSVRDRRHRVAWPIGFYFAKLWYHERLYPLVFTAAALGKFLRTLEEDHEMNWPH